MYYQHCVIFEALHVICKQLKIIYYPKLYRSIHVCILISFIKNGVVLIHTHIYTFISDTVCFVTLDTCFLIWKEQEDSVRSEVATGHSQARCSQRITTWGLGFAFENP